MVFTTLEFICVFLPILLLVYVFINKKLANLLLLAASLFFYYCGDNSFLILLLSLLFVVYIFGIFIDKYRKKKIGKVLLFISIAIILSVLTYFKYTTFLMDNLAYLFNFRKMKLNILLPLGISFFSFQMISYLVDVYRKEKAIRNPIDLGLYICFFPQLIAGPIVRYKDIKEYLDVKYRKVDFDRIADGIIRFCVGLSKKVLIANNFGGIVKVAFDMNVTHSVLFYWLGAIAFTLELYYDFSGYSDMAIGLAKVFGFNIQENFNYPLAAKSIKDFWKRWHISLSSFFKDYVYIPLGGNKCSKRRHIFNLMFVWFLTGLWHGASWTFVLWGVLYGIFILIEEKVSFKGKLWGVIQRVLTLLIVLLLFVIFNSNGLDSAFKYILSMFGIGVEHFIDYAFVYHFSNYFLLLLIGIVLAFPVIPKLKEKFKDNLLFNIVIYTLLFICVVVSIASIYMYGYNPFLYFNF